MIWLLLFIVGCGLIIQILLNIFWVSRFELYKPANKEKFISILIAARNEESNIKSCLEALLNQDYPSNKYEILVGNDASEDKTLEIISRFSQEHPQVQVYNITKNIGLARGKANVLAQLVHEAKGDIFLITDADITVNKSWISGMTSHANKDTGIVNGFTVVEDNLMQHYEWAHALGMVKVITDLGQPVTAIGNNMLITKEAYRSTGGFENIPFSLTEDFDIFKAVSKNHYQIKQVVNEDVLAFTKPPQNLKTLFHQRKRWMTGAVQLPWYIVLILLLEGLYYPAIFALIIMAPMVALYAFLTKLVFQSLFIKLVLKKVGLPLKGGLLIYEVYAAFSASVSMINYILPGKIDWKGRRYKKQ